MENHTSNLELREKILYSIAFLFIIIGVIIAIIFIVRLSTNFSFNGNELDMESTGQTGDFFGGVIGAIWSFAGILLFFIALQLQKKELNEQISELRETRNVFIHQKFDSTFFHLLGHHNSIKQSLEITHKKNSGLPLNQITSTGIKLGFDNYFDSLKESFKSLYNDFDVDSIDELGEAGLSIIEKLNYTEDELDILFSSRIDKAKRAYLVFYSLKQNDLGHYFRNIYHILKLISESEKEELELGKSYNIDPKKIEDKYKNYAAYLQGQLSTSELFLLFYNGLIFERMTDRINKFSLLENLQIEELLDQSHALQYKFPFKRRNDLVKLLQ